MLLSFLSCSVLSSVLLSSPLLSSLVDKKVLQIQNTKHSTYDNPCKFWENGAIKCQPQRSEKVRMKEVRG